MKRSLFSLLLSLAVTSPAAAEYLNLNDFADGVRFGSEMTISNENLLKSYSTTTVQVRTRLADQYVRQMGEGIARSYWRGGGPTLGKKYDHSHWLREAITLNYPSGFGLTIFPDPGVIELNSSPSSQRQVEANVDVIQRDFFDQGKALGLEPALFTGSGHMHIELTKLHPVTVRNFLANFYNKTGLAAGAFNEDVYNAIGSGEMPEKNKERLRLAFAAFDADDKFEIKPLIKKLKASYRIRYQDDLEVYRKNRKEERFTKYVALSFESFFTLGTLEIRSLRPQASAASYLKLVKLFVAQFELAERRRLAGERVVVGAMPSVLGDPQAVIADLDRYVSEVGFDIRDFREFVMPWWQARGGEFDLYLKAKAKAARAARGKNRCSAIFSR